jgi:hypothetical protein
MGRLSSFFAFLKPKPKFKWEYINGTRNTVLETRTKDGFYGKEEFRINATKNIKLNKGEVIYGELVGYTENGAPIMAQQDTTKLKDKGLVKRFGNLITYKYGCNPGCCKLYIYRITYVNEDGMQIDLPWVDVVKRCKELGLETVPHIETFIFDGDYEALKKKVNTLTDGESGMEVFPSVLDNTHIEEGVVLRVESPEYKTYWLKAKNTIFLILEGVLKDSDNFVDTEEIS